MFREKFSEQGEVEDQNIAFWKIDYVVFLLGSGFPPEALEFRKKAGKALKNSGYNILVMEELDGAPLFLTSGPDTLAIFRVPVVLTSCFHSLL